MSGTPNAWERYFPTFRRTNERLERWMGRLPLRGRGLLFAAGAVIGGGGLSSVALWIDRRDASAILASASLGGDDDDDDSGTVCCGAVERWVSWPYPHWQASDAELNRRLLLLRPRKSGAAKTTSSVVLAEGGERCTAVPLKGATVTPAGGSGKPLSLSIKTAAGHHETLRNFSVGDSAQQWQLSLEAAAGPAKPSQAAKVSAPKRVMAVTYPDHWEAPFDRYRTVQLSKTSAEYKRVEALALKQQKRRASGWVRGRISVTGIERVQSPQVWEQYCMRRAIVASGNGGDANEMMLWHGTPSRSCGVIGRQGFDPRVCSLQGMFGGGVRPDTSQRVFLVACGVVCVFAMADRALGIAWLH